MLSPGARFRRALKTSKGPLQIVGTVNAYSALLARHAGAQALYLSGSGVAMASFGLPDLGITNLHDVAEDARRITAACDLPLLVDIDTGFGSHFGISRTVQEMMRAGVAAVHMEDQAVLKRCGHRPNKQIVSKDEMLDRIKSVLDAKKRFSHLDKDFVLIARTDALASEGLDSALKRAQSYLDAGADMLFPEACTTIEEYKAFKQLKGPDGERAKILANLTEFGETPLFSAAKLGRIGVDMALYPLSAQRAAAKAMLKTYEVILNKGSQQSMVPQMQTREECYDVLEYHSYEDALDQLFEKEK